MEKEYFLRCSADQVDPFSFDGPVIVSSKGTEIIWKPGKDVTKQVEQFGIKEFEVKVESFFNFFKPPETTTGDEESGASESNVRIFHKKFWKKKLP